MNQLTLTPQRMEAKIKHLEFLQAVITRMNSNSFLIKGWAAGLASALFGLAAKDANWRFAGVAYFAVLIFWILDGFFIATERRYRDLYRKTAELTQPDPNFTMALSDGEDLKFSRTWIGGIFSQTLIPFYLGLMIIPIGIYFAFK